MSERRTSLEQQRACFAWECISNVKGHPFAAEYARLAKSVPAQIQVSGLGQTLAFLRARGYDKGRPAGGGANGHYRLLEDVSEWVCRRLGLQQSGLLEWIIMEASTEGYRRATAEAMAFLIWLKRFAEAELGG